MMKRKHIFCQIYLPYSKIINYVNKSKCIVDIVQKEQGGLTWRPLKQCFIEKTYY